MIIIPERELVIITPPRTGSTSMLTACKLKYPLTMSLYRHMEADGIPFGYDHWRRVGIVRHPFLRLWSLYHYLRDLPDKGGWYSRLGEDARSNPFSYWLREGTMPFTNPDWIEDIDFSPRQSVLHNRPEQRKSQWMYVRPDLGVEPIVVASKEYVKLILELDLPRIPILNKSRAPAYPSPSDLDKEHIEKFHSWDIDICERARVG